MSVQFKFSLDAIDDIAAFGEAGARSLHWFGLTQGEYWIDTPVGDVFRYTEAFNSHFGGTRQYCDYYVSRLFEDVQEHLPAILEPVPRDIAHWATSDQWLTRLQVWLEQETPDEGNEWMQYEKAMSWFWQRGFGTNYLTSGPEFYIWRVDDNLHFRWRTRRTHQEDVRVWVVPEGEIEMSAHDFESAAIGFCQDVLASMADRLAHIVVHGWPRTDCVLDIDGLLLEHHQREDRLRQLLAQRRETDWDGVRRALEILKSRLGWSS